MPGGANKRLFNNVSILDVLPDQARKIKAKIHSLAPDYVLNASEEDLVASLADEYTLDFPVLDEAKIHVDYGEHQIDVSRDPMRFIPDPSRPFYVAGTQVTFVIPFTGRRKSPYCPTANPVRNFIFLHASFYCRVHKAVGGFWRYPIPHGYME